MITHLRDPLATPSQGHQALSVLCISSGSLSMLHPKDGKQPDGNGRREHLLGQALARLSGWARRQQSCPQQNWAPPKAGCQLDSLWASDRPPRWGRGEKARWERHIGQGQETREGSLQCPAITRDMSWGSSIVRILWGQQPPIPLVLPLPGSQAGVTSPRSIASTKMAKMALPAHPSLISLMNAERLCVRLCVCVCAHVCAYACVYLCICVSV